MLEHPVNTGLADAQRGHGMILARLTVFARGRPVHHQEVNRGNGIGIVARTNGSASARLSRKASGRLKIGWV